MPPTKTDEGLQVAERLRESDPEVGVVALSQYSEPAYVLKLLEAGSDPRRRNHLPASVNACGAATLIRKQDFRPALLRQLWAVHGC